MRQSATGLGRAAAVVGTLSDTDRAILAELTRDPFASNRVIAEALALPISTIISRLRLLEHRNLSRVRAVLDLARLGHSFCFIYLEVRRRAVVEVAEDVARLRQVMMVSELGGGAADLLVLLRFENIESLNRLLYGEIAVIAGAWRWRIDIVIDVPVFRAEYVTFMPAISVSDVDRNYEELRHDLPSSLCDDIDRRLIAHLQQNAHQSINAIARKTGLSASTARYRINNLKSSGILRFIRVIDHTLAGIEAFFLLELDIDVGLTAAIVDQLSNRAWLPQLFVCAGQSVLLGIILATSNDEILRIKHEEISTIAGIHGITINPLHQTRKSDFGWAQEFRPR